ncbi:uncharacterized protein G2W53_009967 [Senna tora]|uniref:Uncharacterized protein n=1 Tax=Senna tora TaxID=362788 RepID=A0A834X084_9FABA|nr:uncharacterized protein G2W53_009967 [Senna tora]
MGGAWIMSYHILDEKSRLDLRNLHELRGKRLVAQVSQTRRFALYSRTGVVLMLRLELSWHGRSVDHVLTYFGRQIAVGSQKPSRFTRQKTCCASESNTSVRVEFANRSGVDAPIGVVLAWEEERGSCLNKFRTTNRGRISETFTNYEAKDLLRKNLHKLRGKRLVAQVSQTRRYANRSGFDAPIGVVLAWEERASCLNIFRTTNRGRISETLTNYEAKDLLRKRKVVTVICWESLWHFLISVNLVAVNLSKGIGKVNFWYKEGRMNVWFERIMSMRLNSKTEISSSHRNCIGFSLLPFAVNFLFPGNSFIKMLVGKVLKHWKEHSDGKKTSRKICYVKDKWA